MRGSRSGEDSLAVFGEEIVKEGYAQNERVHRLVYLVKEVEEDN